MLLRYYYSAMFAGGGVRFHTAVVFLAACHIYSWFLPVSWVLDLSTYFVVYLSCVYVHMFG